MPGQRSVRGEPGGCCGTRRTFAPARPARRGPARGGFTFTCRAPAGHPGAEQRQQQQQALPGEGGRHGAPASARTRAPRHLGKPGRSGSAGQPAILATTGAKRKVKRVHREEPARGQRAPVPPFPARGLGSAQGPPRFKQRGAGGARAGG